MKDNKKTQQSQQKIKAKSIKNHLSLLNLIKKSKEEKPILRTYRPPKTLSLMKLMILQLTKVKIIKRCLSRLKTQSKKRRVSL